MASPYSQVIWKYLIDKGVITAPGGAGPFFGYYAKEPNDELDPNDVVTIYDDMPKYDMGRMRGNQWYGHPGINIRIRSADDSGGDAYSRGWNKGQEIVTALSQLSNTSVVVVGDPTTYRIVCYTVGQGLVFLKEEDPVKKRQLFTINGGHITIWTGS